MKQLGELLVEWGILTEEQLTQALREQMRSGKLLGEILVELGMATLDDITRAIIHLGTAPAVDLDVVIVDVAFLEEFPRNFLLDNHLLPLWRTPERVAFATPNPGDIVLRDRLSSMLRSTPFLYHAPKPAIARILSLFFPEVKTETLRARWAPEKTETAEELHPAILQVHRLLSTAINRDATDLYIEPSRNFARYRFRQMRTLSENFLLQLDEYHQLLEALRSFFHIKQNGDLLVGRRSIRYRDQEYQLKATVLKTVLGEMWHILLSIKAFLPFRIEQLGLQPDAVEYLRQAIHLPGIFFVIGYPGEGKSHTLYTFLLESTSPHRNIITLEEPVEIHFPHINQVSVSPSQNLAFLIESVAEQRWGVLMVSEVRQKEELQALFRAAENGMTVFCGFTASSCLDALLRFLSLGIDSYSLISYVRCLIVQRLVRTICSGCKESVEVSEHYGNLFGSADQPLWLFEGKGCALCNYTGYSGKTGLFELLCFTPEVKRFLEKNPGQEELKKVIPSMLLHSLLEDGKTKAQMGVTTMEEVQRVSH